MFFELFKFSTGLIPGSSKYLNLRVISKDLSLVNYFFAVTIFFLDKSFDVLKKTTTCFSAFLVVPHLWGTWRNVYEVGSRAGACELHPWRMCKIFSATAKWNSLPPTVWSRHLNSSFIVQLDAVILLDFRRVLKDHGRLLPQPPPPDTLMWWRLGISHLGSRKQRRCWSPRSSTATSTLVSVPISGSGIGIGASPAGTTESIATYRNLHHFLDWQQQVV